MIRNCKVCGKEFKTKQSQVDRGGGKFCSIKCRSHGHSFTRHCWRCGREFVVELNRERSNRGHFCSRACRITPVAERFWSKVNKSGPVPGHRPHIGNCWVWTSSTDALGYGIFRVSQKKNMQKAHRVSWAMAAGDPGRLLVLHKCDNPSCCRPDHLFLGTDQDNCDDKHAKGRANILRGSATGRAKVTEAQVHEIRASNETASSLARRFGLGKTTVSHILKRESWRHV